MGEICCQINTLLQNVFNTTRLQWSRIECTCLDGHILCLEFTIEIESNSLMHNPNKEIRNKVFPVKIGNFSVNYYTFKELQR